MKPIIGPNNLPLTRTAPKEGTAEDCCCDCEVVANFTYAVDVSTTGTGTGTDCEFGSAVVTFTDLSTTPTGSIAWRRWRFGDDSPVSYATNPVHTYDEPGTYRVELDVSNGNCVSKKITYVIVPNCCPAVEIVGPECGRWITNGTFCMWALLELNLVSREYPQPNDACDQIEDFVYLDDPGFRSCSYWESPGIFEPPTPLITLNWTNNGYEYANITHCNRCVDGKAQVSILLWTAEEINGIRHTYYWICAAKLFSKPTEIYSGFTVELEDGGCNCDVLSGTVTFLGLPCDSNIDCGNGPVVSFTMTQRTGCSYSIDTTITLGDCTDSIDDLVCVWSDGVKGCDRVFANLCHECGEPVEGVLTLRVWDPRGCMGEYSVEYSCCCCDTPDGSCGPGACGCNDPGDILPTGVTWSQPDPEEDPCLFEFVVDGNCGMVAICGLGVSTGLSNCTCDGWEEEPALADLCGGCLKLDAGTTTQVHIPPGCHDVRIFIMEGPCGCRSEPILDEICCGGECDCCMGPISGAKLTVSGIGDGGNDCCACNCALLNGEYEVPNNALEGCGGYLSPELVPIGCDNNPEGEYPLFLEWYIGCEEIAGVMHYWLGVYFALGEENGHSRSAEIYLGTIKPECDGLSHTFNLAYTPSIDCDYLVCCGDSVSITVELRA